MYLNLPMLKRLTRRLLSKKISDFESIADRTQILCPEETLHLQPAIYLQNTLDRIKRLSPYSEREATNLLIKGGKRVSAPTKVHIIKNVEVVGAHLYSGALKITAGYGKEKIFSSARMVCHHLDVANLVTTWSGSRFFGSLLLDDFPLELLPEDRHNNLRVVTKFYGHEQGYRDYLGINTSTIFNRAFVKRLRFYEDPTHNSHKARRYKMLREQLREIIQADPEKTPRYIYLRRGDTGEPRTLVNEEEIQSVLHYCGFETVDTSTLDATEILRRTIDARVVVGIEGSHLSHAIFSMKEDGTMIVLQPPDRFAMVYKDFTDCLGMRFAFLVGNQKQGGFTILRSEMTKILELVL